jgi:tryptophan 2-C-methyltransferase
MLTLINTNRMRPPIAPVGLDYVGGALQERGIPVELLDLGLADDPAGAMAEYFAHRQPALVGLSFRNVDDCFWPSGRSFLPLLQQDVAEVRRHTAAPLVLGGVGYSICAAEILARSGADFGIRGDGEEALALLHQELRGGQRWERVPGLVHVASGRVRENPPAWPDRPPVPPRRDLVDNRTYFRRGGQLGLETKRGCPRRCTYCVDALAKGRSSRLRDPIQVADEVQSLVAQGIDVLHLCDAEFNLPLEHALSVCDELIRRGLGARVRWYAYLSVLPFPDELAGRMRRAGCVGINFTSDSTHPAMLAAYGQPHTKDDLAQAVRNCRTHGIRVMLDLLLGGPGETPETVAQTIADVKQIGPDCDGAALGLRLYPHTPLIETVAAEGPLESNPSLRRGYAGPVDLVQPTFYLSVALGPHAARLVRDLIAGDERFFPPEDETPPAGQTAADHNYNDNQRLVDAINAGARGAYWDILTQVGETSR